MLICGEINESQRVVLNYNDYWLHFLTQGIQRSSITLVILSTVAVFDLVKASQARVVAALSLGITATVGLSSDRHSTGDRRDHHRWEVCLRVRITELEKEWKEQIVAGSHSGIRLTQSYFLQGRTADMSYLYEIIAPVFTFRGQNERPSISIPPYTTPDIPPRTTISASPWHDKRCLNRQRICQSEHTWVQVL